MFTSLTLWIEPLWNSATWHLTLGYREDAQADLVTIHHDGVVFLEGGWDPSDFLHLVAEHAIEQLGRVQQTTDALGH